MLARPLADRFWEKVDVRSEDECWNWTAGKNSDGYGYIKEDGGVVQTKATTVCWRLHYGPLPEGLLILHSCDNPPCVNPKHLRLGTHRHNTSDKVSRQRHPFGSKHGMAKINEEIVRQIRQEVKQGVRQSILSERYGLSSQSLSNIVLRKSWTHV